MATPTAEKANTPAEPVDTGKALEQARRDAEKALKAGDLDGMLKAAEVLKAAQAAHDRGKRAREAEAFAAGQANRDRLANAIRELGYAPVAIFNEALEAGLTIRYGRNAAGESEVTVTMPVVKGTRKASNGTGGKGRHRIAYNGEVMGSRAFLTAVAAGEGEHATMAAKALDRVDNRPEGTMSPGFDTTVKALIAAGVGEFVTD